MNEVQSRALRISRRFADQHFEKFLVGRDGGIAARFSPVMAPNDDRIVTAVEQELQAAH